MRRILGCCFISLAVAGCPDTDDPATEDDTGSSSDGSGGSPTSMPPATTVPGGDDDGSASATGTSTGEPPATTGDDTGPATGDDTGTDTGSGSGSESGSESSSGGTPDAGVCVAACRDDADCCPAGAIGCPSEDYPNNWTCVEGACSFGGCSEDAECAGIIPIGDPQCFDVSGVGVCGEPCEKDGDCPIASNTECVGVADDASMYCTTPVDPCENDDDCDGSGTCDTDSGTCVCTSADDCTDPDLAACSVSG